MRDGGRIGNLHTLRSPMLLCAASLSVDSFGGFHIAGLSGFASILEQQATSARLLSMQTSSEVHLASGLQAWHYSWLAMVSFLQ